MRILERSTHTVKVGIVSNPLHRMLTVGYATGISEYGAFRTPSKERYERHITGVFCYRKVAKC